MFTPEPGMIGFSSNDSVGGLEGLYYSLVKFFSRSRYAHCWIIAEPLNGVPQVQQAWWHVITESFSIHYTPGSSLDDYVVYKIKEPTAIASIPAALKTMQQYNGMTYGYLQLPYFIFRYFLGWIFKINNPIHQGIICSGLDLKFLIALNGPISEAALRLDEYSTSPEDLLEFVEAHPEWFELVYTNKIGVMTT